MKTEDDFWYKKPLDRIRTLFRSVFGRIKDFFEVKNKNIKQKVSQTFQPEFGAFFTKCENT